jgi:zinc transporter ZupT
MSAIRWLESKPFAQQIVVLTSVLDPLGALVGFLFLPDLLGVEPLMGAVYGLVASSVPVSLWVMRYQQKHTG